MISLSFAGGLARRSQIPHHSVSRRAHRLLFNYPDGAPSFDMMKQGNHGKNFPHHFGYPSLPAEDWPQRPMSAPASVSVSIAVMLSIFVLELTRGEDLRLYLNSRLTRHDEFIL